MAAPTPVADANAVYALFATGDLVALDHAGNQLWYRSIVGDYPTVSNQVGMASSPVLHGGKLFVPMENSGDSFIAALDVKTGKNVWKTARPRGTNWTTPTVRTVGDKETEVLFHGPKGLVAYDADSGSEKWAHKSGGAIPSPTVIGGDLMLAGGGVVRLTPKDGGGWTEVWKSTKLQLGDTSPLFYGDRVYTTDPRGGAVYCTDAKTGKAVWDEKILGAKQSFCASPLAADGKIYTLTEKGTLTVFKAGGTEADILGTSEVGATCVATPAISGGAVFIRTDDLKEAKNNFLLCVGKK
jgi:outer membrane protein assembly factor BamB